MDVLAGHLPGAGRRRPDASSAGETTSMPQMETTRRQA
jgi:hypothetical protein